MNDRQLRVVAEGGGWIADMATELLAARALLAEIRADAERGAAEMDVIAEINKVLR